MKSTYAEVASPRFTVEASDGREQIIIKAQRSILVVVFLFCWLGGWTVAGASTMAKLSQHLQPFLLFWLGGWAVGEIYALGTLCWLVSGAEILGFVGSDLEVSYRVFGLSRTKLFRGREIRHLSASAPQKSEQFEQPSVPFFTANKTGSVKFEYGPRTIYLAAGLDEAEGRLIVNRLRARLPSTAV